MNPEESEEIPQEFVCAKCSKKVTEYGNPSTIGLICETCDDKVDYHCDICDAAIFGNIKDSTVAKEIEPDYFICAECMKTQPQRCDECLEYYPSKEITIVPVFNDKTKSRALCNECLADLKENEKDENKDAIIPISHAEHGNCQKFTCANCKKESCNNEEGDESTLGLICEECTELFEPCDMCDRFIIGKLPNSSIATEIEPDYLICMDCMKKFPTKCQHCMDYFPRKEMQTIIENNKKIWICEICNANLKKEEK